MTNTSGMYTNVLLCVCLIMSVLIIVLSANLENGTSIKPSNNKHYCFKISQTLTQLLEIMNTGKQLYVFPNTALQY